MAEFGDFGEQTAEDIEYLQLALANLGMAKHTTRQFERFLATRGTELDDDADDMEREEHYVTNDPGYEDAVKEEYEAMLAAARGLAAYYRAQDKTEDTRNRLERVASRILIDANKFNQSDEITSADIANILDKPQ